MTTTQPPLQPGDRVLVVCEAVEPIPGEIWLRPVRTDGRQAVTTFRAGIVRWHPMPGPASPDPDAAAHVAELERELVTLGTDAARAFRERDSLARRLGLRFGEIEALRAELDRMRPVVAAAEAVRDATWSTLGDDTRPGVRLVAAVDAYRAGQKAPETAPESTLSHERSEDAPSDGSAHSDVPRASEAVDRNARFRRESLGAWPADAQAPAGTTAGRVVVCQYGGHCATGDCSGPCGNDERDDARPQPPDAPARRDWAGEIRAAIGDAMAQSIVVSWDQVADYVVAALGLRKLEDERDQFRADLAWVTKDRNLIASSVDEYRAAHDRLDAREGAEIGTPGQSVTWVLRDLDEARRARDEGVGKLDALRHEVMVVVGEMRDRMERNVETRVATLVRWERTLCAPLLAGDTSTPDGTTTAETGGAA